MKPVLAGLCVVALSLVGGCAPREQAGPRVAVVATRADLPARHPEVKRLLPGGQSDGSILLPNQWSLRPAGRQITMGDFPVNIALHPAGRFAAVLHCGYGEHEIIVVDVVTAKTISRTIVDEAFYGLSFSGDGTQLACSGAASEVVHLFRFEKGYLSEHRALSVNPPATKGVPAGLAWNAAGNELHVANLWSHRLAKVKLDGTNHHVTEVMFTTNAPSVVQPAPRPVELEAAAITKRAEAQDESVRSDDPFPYGVQIDEAKGRIYVSLWAQAAVAVIDIKSGQEVARWATEEHPNELVLNKAGTLLYVANANRNSVTVLETATGRTVETLVAALYPDPAPGNTPNSVALSPDERRLYVANANINTVSVFDVSDPGRSRSIGFIPVGWYPTSVRVTPDGKKLLVANGKGLFPKPNRHGPQPGLGLSRNVREYIGNLLPGALSIINLAGSDEKMSEDLKKWTAQAYQCRPRRGDAPPVPPEGTPIPVKLGDPSPIKYCLYIIKENRTYDQVLGDLPQGNGDPSLCLFPEAITPNHHKLAREFVLLDNFYVESEVSADGHEWTVGAYATDFVEKMWPLSYGHNQTKKYVYPSEGRFPIATPAGGYLWDRAREAKVTYRSYGEFIDNGKTAADPGVARMPALRGHFDPHYRGFDMDYPDVKRAERYIEELRRFEKEGEMPRLQIIRLPNDHTSGTKIGAPTPRACMADNDQALGNLVEAVSRSRFWAQTAIFVVEDDAQNGPDHVDAHRTIAYVISPFARRGAVDSTMYSTASMLRTMELILGMRPMSQFDAAALPMFNSFQTKPDVRPYQSVKVGIDLNELNVPGAWGAEEAAKMDFKKEDAADDLALNEMVWRSVRGPNSPMPPPVRAGYVIVRGAVDDDD